ncbi:hypothetical protein KM043_016411 [Ampulex compressa]|nr:hypothetical protein KM043_016411 [Ampulex compressa]
MAQMGTGDESGGKDRTLNAPLKRRTWEAWQRDHERFQLNYLRPELRHSTLKPRPIFSPPRTPPYLELKRLGVEPPHGSPIHRYVDVDTELRATTHQSDLPNFVQPSAKSSACLQSSAPDQIALVSRSKYLYSICAERSARRADTGEIGALITQAACRIA